MGSIDRGPGLAENRGRGRSQLHLPERERETIAKGEEGTSSLKEVTLLRTCNTVDRTINGLSSGEGGGDRSEQCIMDSEL